MDVDFVVLWVDGNDPAWQKEKAEYSGRSVDESSAVNRFRDWGLMKYWFRGVEKFTPWVRKVHFVTWGHLPDFLNTANTKLHIVNHRDYLKAEYLPTFSSHVLEMNMHRIPGLSEHFVYFNDDTFLLKPLEEKFFFDSSTGYPRCYCVEMPLRVTDANIFWQHILSNDLGILNKNLRKSGSKKTGRFSLQYDLKDNARNICMGLLFPEYFTGFKIFHAPASFLRSSFTEIWDREHELLDSVSRHKFRDPGDINQWLVQFWQMAKGTFSPGLIGKDSALYDVKDSIIADICDSIKKTRRSMICVNDPSENVNFEMCSGMLSEAFEHILPEKCSFEL